MTTHQALSSRRSFLRRSAVAGAVAAAALNRLDYSNAAITTLRPPRGYRLAWHDEFDRDGRPNPRYWGCEHGFVRNHEAQWYQPENAFCRDGRLIIQARRQRVKNPDYRADGDWRQRRQFAEYTSAALSTRGKRAWQFGLFAMRARLDTRPGLWPAWWMLGISKPWPACGEIDIMEYYAGHVNANVAWQNAAGRAQWVSKFTPVGGPHDPFWAKRFHLWVMDWQPSYIRLYMDGTLYNHIDLTRTLDPRFNNFNPFHQPAYMILDLAVGGRSGGNPAGTRFPGYFEVDYIRVYQRR